MGRPAAARVAARNDRPLTVRVRRAAVAGRFYPDDPAELARLVDRLLATVLPARVRPATAPAAPVGLIAPHAGYRYSGQVAAAAYASLAAGRVSTARVVVLGPAHATPLTGMAVPAADAFATPLGPVEVDAAARATAVSLDGVEADDEPHAPEHSIETQLPFLQRALGTAVPVLPVVVGETPPEPVARLIEALGGPGTVTVVSTDLSHYLDVTAAHERDARTVEAIVARQDRALRPRDACGFFALRGLLSWAAGDDLDVTLLRLATSADVGGDPHRVVGYGAFVVGERRASAQLAVAPAPAERGGAEEEQQADDGEPEEALHHGADHRDDQPDDQEQAEESQHWGPPDVVRRGRLRG